MPTHEASASTSTTVGTTATPAPQTHGSTPARRRGRRPGGASSRADVLGAATRLFAREGFSATTIRQVAAEAGVDPALVIQFYGSKAMLFTAVLDGLRDDVPTLLAGVREARPDERGRRLAEAYFGFWEDPRTGLAAQALVRGAVGSPQATELLQRFLTRTFFAATAQPVLATAGAMLLGLAVTRYVVQVGPTTQMPLEQLVSTVAPALQPLLEGL